VNKQALDELAAGYHNENTCAEALKKLKDIDNFASKSVLIGNALYFRDVLHEAARQTVEEKTPYIYDSIKSMFAQYSKNTYVQHELIPSDALAYDAGKNSIYSYFFLTI
jgi:predicted metal-dependent HD superfamily phosphohydrolase